MKADLRRFYSALLVTVGHFGRHLLSVGQVLVAVGRNIVAAGHFLFVLLVDEICDLPMRIRFFRCFTCVVRRCFLRIECALS